MVNKIPKDHRGLYLSVPYTHGKQTKLKGVSSKERKELSLSNDSKSLVTDGNVQVRTTQRLKGEKK